MAKSPKPKVTKPKAKQTEAAGESPRGAARSVSSRRPERRHRADVPHRPRRLLPARLRRRGRGQARLRPDRLRVQAGLAGLIINTTRRRRSPRTSARRPAATSTSPSSPTSTRTTSTASRPGNFGKEAIRTGIGETWLAWTEDPEDDVANALRKTFKDKLLGLVAARNRLAAAGDGQGEADRRVPGVRAGRGGRSESAGACSRRGAPRTRRKSLNKQAMKLFKDRAERA